MALLTLGLNHTTAPVELREQVAFDAQRLPDALAELTKGFLGVRESAILSTCNRTELFLAIDGEGEPEVVQWLANYHSVEADALAPHIYSFKHLKAAQHMMRVASGLDSLVLGEPQILGQFKDAIRTARDAPDLWNRARASLFESPIGRKTGTHRDCNRAKSCFSGVRIGQFGEPNFF